MKPWIRNVTMGLGIPAALSLSGFLGYAILSHAEDPDREKRLSDVESLTIKLGNIHEADEAAREERVKLCNAGAIMICSMCRDVGVELEKCKR